MSKTRAMRTNFSRERVARSVTDALDEEAQLDALVDERDACEVGLADLEIFSDRLGQQWGDLPWQFSVPPMWKNAPLKSTISMGFADIGVPVESHTSEWE